MSKGNSADARALIEEAQGLLEQALHALGAPARNQMTKVSPAAKVVATKVDFSTPFRAFIKRHAGTMSGAKKFVLVAAYLAKGDQNVAVELAEIKRRWNSVTAKGLLGLGFNYKYPAEAKENDWVDSTAGVYTLRPSWKEIFE